jgi:hypothetical protein
MIINILQQIRSGALIEDLSEELREIVAGVHETGKAGTLTLVIDVTPVKKMPGTVAIGGDIKAKVPKADKKPALFFSDEDGGLHRSDPRQREIEFTAGSAESDDAVACAAANN